MIRRTSRRIESSSSETFLKSHLGIGLRNQSSLHRTVRSRRRKTSSGWFLFRTVQKSKLGTVLVAVVLLFVFYYFINYGTRNRINNDLNNFSRGIWRRIVWFNRWENTNADADVDYNATGLGFRKTRDEYPYTIFYNIYIPPNNSTAAADAVAIVTEQLQQVARSVATRNEVIVHYVIIGDPVPLLKGNMLNRLCQLLHKNLTCSLLDVYDSATEEVTLQRMHDFCNENPKYRVSYIHSKGSYHANVKNTHWRRALTDAAVADGCINPPGDVCNLCGIQFFTQFTFFIPGNMFTAHCDYIRKLLPFDEYKTKREEAVMNVLSLRLRNQLKAVLIWDQRDFYGLDRYSDEHWVGSHPDVIPCDMDPIGSLEHVFQGVTTNKDFSWGMGPRNKGVCGGINDRLQASVSTDVSIRQREIQLLPGNIVKWYSLYNRIPGKSSWVWDYFPDGVMWRNAVKKYGRDAVNVVTKKYVTSLDGSSVLTSFAPFEAPANETDFSTKISLDTESATDRAFFYHIAISDGPDAVESRSMVEQQLEIIQSSFAAIAGKNPIPFYYTLSGTDVISTTSNQSKAIQDVERFCMNNSRFACQRLPACAENFEGETIKQLYNYCQANPQQKVLYLHNQGPVQLRYKGGNEKLIRHLTMAVTSKHCIHSLDATCNVCGLVFYMLWTFFFPGNMFASTCAYVNRLIQPPDYENLLNEYNNVALLSRIRLKLQTNIFPDRIDFFGLDRHAIEFWIGSHPEFKPCDLSGSVHTLVGSRATAEHYSTRRLLHQKESYAFDYWRNADRPSQNFQLEVTPGRLEGPFDYNASKLHFVVRNESLVRREYYLLAGHVHRWLFLYDDVPRADSWIWKLMPEGRIWYNGYQDYGTDVVDKLTEQYAIDDL